MGSHDREPFTKVDKLLLESERFSELSSEMAKLLTSLTEEIRVSAAELQEVQAEVDLKKRELEDLRGREKSVEILGRQVEELRRQKEDLDRLILEQRTLWDTENSRRAREEAEFAENLKILRQREEEEYRRMRADEQEKAKRHLEDQLAEARQKDLDSRRDLEKEMVEREASLRSREQEWRQLVQELEKFMVQLEKRVRNQADRVPLASMNASAERESLLAPEFFRASAKSEEDIIPDHFSMWGNA